MFNAILNDTMYIPTCYVLYPLYATCMCSSDFIYTSSLIICPSFDSGFTGTVEHIGTTFFYSFVTIKEKTASIAEF